jgi:hypothetical protein
MKSSDGLRIPRIFIIVCVAVIAAGLVGLNTHAGSIATTLRVVNNSSREIRNVYTSPTDSDNWGTDLLGEATIGAGQSQDLSSITCDGQQIKIIAEDQDGCFISTVISCGQGSTWTITNDTARDCGY